MTGLIINRRNLVNGSIIVLISFCYVLANGKKLQNNLETLKHKGTIKTIESENGDVIDCVDIYKQPAFDHPLLQNHTIEMWPNSNQNEDEQFLLQGWNEKGEHCPEGSIPILRSPKLDYPKKVAFTMPHKSTQAITNVDPPGHEYAVAVTMTKAYGSSAALNVWNPSADFGEISLAQTWLVAGQSQNTNTIEAGWIVNTLDSKQTRLFVFWTRDNYGETGCYNLQCPGFVQVNRRLAVGAELKPVSIYNGQQFEIQLTISKDKGNGHWWLLSQFGAIGYWPRNIFTTLADRADYVSWGGEITNSGRNGRHTTTHMGSGHFPREGFKKASYFKALQFQDRDGSFKQPPSINVYASKPSCYDIVPGHNSRSGHFFYYGGPGYSTTCRV